MDPFTIVMLTLTCALIMIAIRHENLKAKPPIRTVFVSLPAAPITPPQPPLAPQPVTPASPAPAPVTGTPAPAAPAPTASAPANTQSQPALMSRTKKSFMVLGAGLWWVLVAMIMTVPLDVVLLQYTGLHVNWQDYRYWIAAATGALCWFLMYPIRDYAGWKTCSQFLSNAGWSLLITQDVFNGLSWVTFPDSLHSGEKYAQLPFSNGIRDYLNMWTQTLSFITFVVILLIVSMLVLGLVKEGLKGLADKAGLIITILFYIAVACALWFGVIWLYRHLPDPRAQISVEQESSRTPAPQVERCRDVPFTFTSEWTCIPTIPYDHEYVRRAVIVPQNMYLQWYWPDGSVHNQSPYGDTNSPEVTSHDQVLKVRAVSSGRYQGVARFFYYAN